MADQQFDEYVKGLTDTVAELNKDLTRLESAIATKDKEIERLREALKPFDKLYGLMDSSSTFQPYQISMDGGTKWYKISISDKQLTAAHEALNQSGEAQNKETK